MNKQAKNTIELLKNVEEEGKENLVNKSSKVDKDDVKRNLRDNTSKYLVHRICLSPTLSLLKKLKNDNDDSKLDLGEHDKMPMKQTIPDMTPSNSSHPPIEITTSTKKRKSSVPTITKNAKLKTSVKEINPSSGKIKQLFESMRQRQSASLQLQLSTLFKNLKNDVDDDGFNLDLGEHDKMLIEQTLPNMTASTSSLPPIEIANSTKKRKKSVPAITKKAKLKTSVKEIKPSSYNAMTLFERVKLKKSAILQLQSQSNKMVSSSTITNQQTTKQKPTSSNHPSQACFEIDKNDVKGSVVEHYIEIL